MTVRKIGRERYLLQFGMELSLRPTVAFLWLEVSNE